MEQWPNFFVVGAPRSGTTSLYEYLKHTKGVFMSPVKEPNHFAVSASNDIFLTEIIRKKSKYLSLFKNVKDEIAVGEASPSYLRDPKASNLIHQFVPKARIIIMLRDPVDRSFSTYLHYISMGKVNLPFPEAIKKALESKDTFPEALIGASLYYEQVKRYLQIFGSKQVKIIIFEEFVKDTRTSLKEILEFLNIDSEPPDIIENIYNPFTVPRGKLVAQLISNKIIREAGKNLLPRSITPKLKKIFDKNAPKPKISAEDRNFLEDFFRDDVKKLQELLDRPLSWHTAKPQGLSSPKK